MSTRENKFTLGLHQTRTNLKRSFPNLTLIGNRMTTSRQPKTITILNTNPINYYVRISMYNYKNAIKFTQINKYIKGTKRNLLLTQLVVITSLEPIVSKTHKFEDSTLFPNVLLLRPR